MATRALGSGIKRPLFTCLISRSAIPSSGGWTKSSAEFTSITGPAIERGLVDLGGTPFLCSQGMIHAAFNFSFS